MKNLTIVLIIFLLVLSLSSTSYAVKIGVFGGYNMYLEDISGTKGGLAFGGMLEKGFGFLDIGLLAGYLPLYSSSTEFPADPSSKMPAYTEEISVSTIPILLYARKGLGPIFIMAGAGLYRSSSINEKLAANVKDSTKTEESKNNFGLALGGGYQMGLGIAGIEIGALYHIISMDDGASTSLTIYAGIKVGF